MEKRLHWLVSTVYEMPDIEKNIDGKRIIVNLVRTLERLLGAKIRYFTEEKDGTWLYLIESVGVLGIYAKEHFEVRGYMVNEVAALRFKESLTKAIERSAPKEMSEEMLNSIVVSETGINGEIELY